MIECLESTIESKIVRDCHASKRKKSNALNNRNWFKGIVTPIAWNKNDQPIIFTLLMDNEEELILKPLSKAISIKSFSNRIVLVQGERTQNEELFINEIVLKNRKDFSKTIKMNIKQYIDDYYIHLPYQLKEVLTH